MYNVENGRRINGVRCTTTSRLMRAFPRPTFPEARRASLATVTPQYGSQYAYNNTISSLPLPVLKVDASHTIPLTDRQEKCLQYLASLIGMGTIDAYCSKKENIPSSRQNACG